MRVLLALALLGLASGAPVPDTYRVASESRLWIDGTATTGSWSCEADAVTGAGEVGADVEGEVSVPVLDLDCGFGPMNRDLRRALGAEEHPTITFVLTDAEALGEEPEPGAWVSIQSTGDLHLAGAHRRLTVDADGRRLPDGRVVVRGEHALRMSDFGVRPPSRALGLVRAHDDIVVRFDLVATPAD